MHKLKRHLKWNWKISHNQKASECDQGISQSHTEYQPTAL